MKNIKLAVGIPTTGSIKYQTVYSLIRMLKGLPFPHTMIFRHGSLIHRAREQIVENAIQAGCTHVLFIDSDMFFEEDAVIKLLERDKEIVSGACNLKKLPLTSVARFNKKSKNEDFILCTGVGTGFLLIDLGVFKKIKKPWFFFEQDLGEDYWFCERAREAGYDIWVDQTVKIGHIGDYIY